MERLVERLDFATRASRLGRRGIAVLSITVHERRPSGSDLAACHQVALARIRDCLEPVDTLSVVEPLTYLVLLERLDEGPFAVHVADHVLQAMRAPFDDGVGLVASIGVSAYPTDGERSETLLDRARQAMEGARMGGGDLVGFCSGAMSVDAQRQLAIERALIGVLDRDELALHYQPQIDMREGSLVGVEALLRWERQGLGRVSPAVMVPVMETTGQILEVGAWVLGEACRQAQRWSEAGRGVRTSVNVSARQLEAPGFESLVEETLARSGLDPTLLELELTESVLVENPAATRATLEGIRARGVRVAVDDFGTGYASLAYVRHFPMDTLKIDREFIRGLPSDAAAAAITSSIITLASHLDLELVAEGVETEAEERFLHAHGCHVIQGFLHARPMPADELERWRGQRAGR